MSDQSPHGFKETGISPEGQVTVDLIRKIVSSYDYETTKEDLAVAVEAIMKTLMELGELQDYVVYAQSPIVDFIDIAFKITDENLFIYMPIRLELVKEESND